MDSSPVSGPSQLPEAILHHFDLTVSPYNVASTSQIEARRETYPSGKLFIDRLLGFADIDGSSYPPTGPAAYRRLLQSIHAADLSRSRQDCFYYYLLRDYDLAFPTAQSDGDMVMVQHGVEAEARSRAEQFASKRRLGSSWMAFMDAYWSLDNEAWATAVDHLCNPLISELNFFPEILSVLSTHVSPPSMSLSLIHNLLLCTQRTSDAPGDAELKMISLASAASLNEAVTFIRSFDPSRQRSMRELLWCWMLGGSTIPAGAGSHGLHGASIKQLVHLPLEQDEMDHLLSFLARPPRGIPSEALSVLHDLVTLRLVHQGQYAEAIQLDKDSAGSAGGDADRQRRREMVREFISILPDVHRRALALDGDERIGKLTEDRDRYLAVNGQVSMETNTRTDRENTTVASGATRPSGSAATKDHDTPAASPAPASQSRPQSPFSGPPRFASGKQDSPALRQRVLSGPFALPRVTSQTGSPAPRRPRQIIDDETSTGVNEDLGSAAPQQQQKESTPVARRTRQASVLSEAEHRDDHADRTEPEATEPQSSIQASRPVRRSKRVVASASQPPESPPRQASLPPNTPPARRTRTRQASQDPTIAPMPGAFDPQAVESVPENEVLDTSAPTASAASEIGNGRPAAGARSRMTRSVSRALLDDEDGHQDGTPKKRQKTKRTIDREESATPAARRTTRASTRASSAMPSEMGSPTPSMASVAKSETGRRRNAARDGSAQPTPRQTRSKRN